MGRQAWLRPARGEGPAGPARPKAEWAVRLAGPKLKKKNIWIKNWIFEFTKALQFAQGDLGGILTWGFFLNSSRLLKYFRKMKYAMPW
jgi:hypothetical protein